MIIRREAEGLYLFAQDDHAKVSGEMAAFWGNDDFKPLSAGYREAVILAARMHDCGWRRADRQIRLNPAGEPYDFVTYPLDERLVIYRQGVDEVERAHAYAALLCSLHYARFIQAMRLSKEGEKAQARMYLISEEERRRRLVMQLAHSSTPAAFRPDGQMDGLTEHHFALLRLWDLLSLLLCMTTPGSRPDTWGAWFGRGEIGMPVSPGAERLVQVRWHGNDRILLDPFPFSEPFQVTVPFRFLDRNAIQTAGHVHEAFRGAEPRAMTISFCDRP